MREYFVPGTLTPHVKVGDHIEAGDVLSTGFASPAEIVRHKGIGEGRKYYADSLYKAFSDSGLSVNKRNFDVIAKAAIDHVRINTNEPVGDYLPETLVAYQSIEKGYKPREEAKEVRLDGAKGMYLETPVLHYTIGTRLTDTILAHLKRQGIQSVVAHAQPPFFQPEMQRLLDVPAHYPDWMHELYSTNLERRLIHAVNTGMTSSLTGPSPIAGLARAVNFSEKKAEEECS